MNALVNRLTVISWAGSTTSLSSCSPCAKFEDTQCGFKMFNRAAAEDLFDVQLMTGIGFDVELIFIALRRGYKIKEIPITWYFDADSRMRLVQDSLRMLQEIWQIRRNWSSKGLYARRGNDR
ncbi:MAG: hypothetical protein HND48_05455 [Chloroflexi bacterium]|nr:hypothetical protein [Chloroflexota bacterium]